MERDEWRKHLDQQIARANRWETIGNTVKMVGFFLLIALLVGGLIWYFAYQAQQAAECRKDCVKTGMKSDTCEWVCRPGRR